LNKIDAILQVLIILIISKKIPPRII